MKDLPYREYLRLKEEYRKKVCTTPIDRRKCDLHGMVDFKRCSSTKKKTGLTSHWYVCVLCLREQWRKAAEKKRKDPVIQEYQRNYSKDLNKIRRHLSVYLTMILYAANIG